MASPALLPHLRRARDLADRHYAEPLDLAALAAAAGVSRYHFARCFAETYGDTPMRHPDHPELELTLSRPGPPLDHEDAAAFQKMLDKGTLGAVGLSTDDCRKTYEELSAKGVAFIQEPADRPYGVEAVLRDNSGNWLVLVERKPFDPSDLG